MRIAPLKIALALVLFASLSFGAWDLFFHHPIPPERSQAIGFEGPTRTSYPDSPRLISSSKYDHTVGVFALYCLLFSSLGEQNQPWPPFHLEKGGLPRQMRSVDRTYPAPKMTKLKSSCQVPVLFNRYIEYILSSPGLHNRVLPLYEAYCLQTDIRIMRKHSPSQC